MVSLGPQPDIRATAGMRQNLPFPLMERIEHLVPAGQVRAGMECGHQIRQFYSSLGAIS